MSGLEIIWPDEAAERVRAARGRLLQAGVALRRREFEDRLNSVTHVLRDWTDPDSAWRRELVSSLSTATDFSEGTISEGLTSALRAWDPAQFAACARHELLVPGRTLAPFEWTTVMAGGAIPMPTILSSLLPLVAGSPVLLRETAKDSVTPGLIARSIRARDESLGACFESIVFPWSDAEALAAALSAPCVVATGSDETISSIAGKISPTQRFVAYGHRFSIGIVGDGIANNPDALRQAAEGIALDVARWDQAGCLSPVVIYLLGVDSKTAESLSASISENLGALNSEMPRGLVPKAALATISTERAEARMRAASGAGMLFEGNEHTVILEGDAQPRPAPLHRFLRLMPVDSLADLNRALTPFAGHLSNVAISGFAHPDRGFDTVEGRLFERLSALGVSQVTFPGKLQTPPVDWPHDGMPLFQPLSRFTSSDYSRA